MTETAWERVAVRVAGRLAAHGALAVAVVGSVARGDTHDGSDVDIVAIGDGPDHVLELVDDVLVSIAWKSAALVRERFDSPLDAGGIVASWREARILHDPRQVATSLQTAAHAWDWSRIAPQCDRVVARELTLWSEDVYRIVGLRNLGERRGAAVVRAAMTTQLPRLLAAHHRILYGSENRLWDLVASVMGPDWGRDFDIALGVAPGAADLAALALFRQAATRVERVLLPAQKAVVDAAVAMSERVA